MSLKILICDDAGFVREILSRAVEQLGHIVVGEAANGHEVVDLALQLQPDVILMDFVLPLKNGAEATRDIKAFLPGVKVVAISSMNEEFLRAQAVETGCDAYLAKPFSKDRLKIILNQFSMPEVQSG